MATPTATDLDKKYMLLAACFPGIQTRKLTQKRYLEKKEEIRRLVKPELKRKNSLPVLTGSPGVPTLPKLPHRSLGDDPVERSFTHLPRSFLPGSVDLSTPSTDQSASISRLKPGVTTLWNRKISALQKKLVTFDNVRSHVRRTL